MNLSEQADEITQIQWNRESFFAFLSQFDITPDEVSDIVSDIAQSPDMYATLEKAESLRDLLGPAFIGGLVLGLKIGAATAVPTDFSIEDFLNGPGGSSETTKEDKTE